MVPTTTFQCWRAEGHGQALIIEALLIGLFGLIVPIFPGITVIWLAALLYGIITGFDTLGIVLFVLITIGMLVGISVDNILMGAGARRGGASWWYYVCL